MESLTFSLDSHDGHFIYGGAGTFLENDCRTSQLFPSYTIFDDDLQVVDGFFVFVCIDIDEGILS